MIDDDQYIVASIVLGEAQGSVENYAYILKPHQRGETVRQRLVWEFDVIMGGVKQTLQARSKYQDVIHELDAGEGDDIWSCASTLTRVCHRRGHH